MGFSKFVSLVLIFHLLTPTLVLSSFLSSSNGLSGIPKKFLDFAKRKEFVDWIVGVRRKIHENPELGYEKFETSKLIRSELDKLGIPYKHPVSVTGVVGFVGIRWTPFCCFKGRHGCSPYSGLETSLSFVTFDYRQFEY
ncbi:hypothetical protein V6N13_084598 [Hibiscus sabdariffa]|uniref:Uncharacterized protein n=1 Tax=Hibiscus sabdariffa TaxID=183260 RepID=A0ABR2T247_9ROSI